MLPLCLSLRVMERPILRRRAVSASNKTSTAFSNTSLCLSNPQELNCESICSSDSRPMAAAAVQVRSHDGWGLPIKCHSCLLCKFIMMKGLHKRPKIREGSGGSHQEYEYKQLMCRSSQKPGYVLYLTEVCASQIHLQRGIYREDPLLPILTLSSPAQKTHRPMKSRKQLKVYQHEHPKFIT